MFGLDPGGIAAQLAKLVASPRVQYGADAIKRALPMASGPLRTTKPGATINQGVLSKRTNPVNGSGAFSGALGAAGALAQAMGGQQDPMMDLYNQLVSSLQQPVAGPTGVNTEDLMNQVKNALNPIYDQRASSASSQSAKGRQEVQGMYGALAQDDERLAGEQVKQAADAQNQMKQIYGQLRSNVEGTYSRVSEEQGDLFKSLGIEAALPDVLADQQAPVQDALIAASENQSQQEQRALDIGQADATYFRQGSSTAKMAGNEISTDMLGQLQNYLQQIEAERGSGIQTAYMDQLGQANSALAQKQQAAQSEGNRRQEMLWQMLQSQLSASQQKPAALTPDTFMSQLPQSTQQSIAGAFTQLQRSPEAVYGKVEDKRNPVPGSFVETTPEWYMAQADQMLNSGAIDPVTHQALLQYMQLYFGTGK